MELGGNEAIKQVIKAGLGVSVLSRSTLALASADNPLTMIDVEGFAIPWKWYVGYNRGKRRCVVAQTFMQFIRAESRHIVRFR